MRFILAISLLLAVSAQADTVHLTNVMTFEVAASREVSNDKATAQLYVEVTDSDPAKLAVRVNRSLAEAVTVVKVVTAVKNEGTGFQSWPVYDRNQKIDSWRARGTLRLSSLDFAVFSKLLGELQQKPLVGEGFRLGNVSYSLATETSSKIERELAEEALQQFRGKAAQLQKSWGAKGWKLLNINLGGQVGMVDRPPLMAAYRAMSTSAAAVETPLVSGESRLSVTASGSIQLQE